MKKLFVLMSMFGVVFIATGCVSQINNDNDTQTATGDTAVENNNNADVMVEGNVADTNNEEATVPEDTTNVKEAPVNEDNGEEGMDTTNETQENAINTGKEESAE